MADVGWVRLSTRMFENRKIKHLLNQTKGAELTLLWVRLLCLAGTINDNGRVYVTAKVTYTPQTLAIDTGVQLAVVKKAWDLFQDLEMIEISKEGYIEIVGWEKHQNVTGLEKIREQNRLRKQKQRERDTESEMSRDSHVTQCEKSRNVTQQRREEKNIDKEKDDYHHPKRNRDDDDDKNLHMEIFSLWEKNMMPLTALIAEKLQGLIGEVGEAAVEQGIIAAVEHGARNFSYVQTVARNFASGKGKQQAKASAGYSSMDLVNELYGEGGQNGDNASTNSADSR